MTKYITGAAFFNRGLDTNPTCEDLKNNNEPRQLAALQQIIANMTIGNDVSRFFNEVMLLISSKNLSIKRLVYLYFVQNCRTNPEKSVLYVGSLTKDTLHNSPLIRGAALRTMSSLQISIMADAATAPLLRCLSDSDPYVRSIAAMGVLKNYNITHLTSFNYELINALKNLLHDPNPMVCGMAVQVILELYSRKASGDLLRAIFDAGPHLLTMLDEATEWPTYYILNGIATSFRCAPSIMLSSDASHPSDTAAHDSLVQMGEELIMRILPYLYISNSAIVMAAVKVVMLFLRVTTDRDVQLSTDQREALDRRFVTPISNALVSLVYTSRYELRYLVLKNIQLFLSTRFMHFFETHLGIFFVQNDDPVYIKLAKLDVLVRLANETNGARVLSKLVVYARDIDVEFSSKSVQSIGLLAITIPTLTMECVRKLEDLIQSKNPHILENAVVVVQNVLRQYPGRFGGIILIVYESLSLLNDEDARAAVAWIIGAYADHVPQAMDYLKIFVDNFMNEHLKVQLVVLTTLVKIRVCSESAKTSENVLEFLDVVLAQCAECQQPDLRDRAFYYQRMLATDIVMARQILSEVQNVTLQMSSSPYERKTQKYIFDDLGSLRSVIQQPIQHALGKSIDGASEVNPSFFFFSNSNLDDNNDDDCNSKDSETSFHEAAVNSSAEGYRFNCTINDDEQKRNGPNTAKDSTPTAVDNSRNRCNSILSSPPTDGLPQPEPTLATNLCSRLIDPEGFPSTIAAAGGMEYQVVLPATAGGGVEVALRWSQRGMKLVLNCRVGLHRGGDFVRRARLTDLQINRNLFSLGVQQVFPPMSLEAEEKPREFGLIVSCNNERRPTRDLEVALDIRPVGVRYVLAPPIPPVMLLRPATGCDVGDFLRWLREIPEPTWRIPSSIVCGGCAESRFTTNALRMYGINLVHRRDWTPSGMTVFFLHAETIGRERLLVDVTVYQNKLVLLTVRCSYAPVAAFWGEYIKSTICAYT
ncbi:unnamed protein product [Phytomonas sp. Hart1]|nr:unnamed protein product [Phytomonas sp. Hart1]|eukprot:CCW68361.1 unnamed protein product [Phytomonas sp. isolate Hart1]